MLIVECDLKLVQLLTNFKSEEFDMRQREIKRDFYLQQLIDHQDDGMIKIVTGVRRCGKSYLLFNLFYDHLLQSGVKPDEIITIALDEERYADLRDVRVLAEYIRSRIKSKKKKYFLFVDEVQYAIKRSEFENEYDIGLYGVLNELLHKSNVDVYVTGSNSKLLTKDVLTAFRGRGWEIRMHPLSFAEYFNHVGGDKRQAYADYSRYGGMPQVLALRSEAEKEEYLKGLFDEVYFKDVVSRYNLELRPVFGEVVNVLCSSVGSLVNASKLARAITSECNVKVSSITVANYLEYLTESFLFSCARRYDVKGKRYFSYPMKYFCEDVGLRNARLNFRQQEPTHIMENVIYNELCRRGYSVDVGSVDVLERKERGYTQKQVEIDFVVNRGSQRLYMQSAYRVDDREKQIQEIRPLLQVGDVFRKIVIVEDVYHMWHSEEGVEFIGVYDFLLHPEIIDSRL